MNRYALLLLPLLLAACSSVRGTTAHTVSSELDMSANRVVESTRAEEVRFLPGSLKQEEMLIGWTGTLPDGASSVTVFAPESDALRERRALHLTRKLRAAGLRSDQIRFLTDAMMEPDTYRLEFAFAYMAQPADCPNWSGMSFASYGNRPHPNLGCAVVTNTGQMLAHPLDLRGSSAMPAPDSARTSLVIEQYKLGKDWSPSATGSNSGYSSKSGMTGSATSKTGSGGGSGGGEGE